MRRPQPAPPAPRSRSAGLEQIVEMLSRTPAVRGELVADIRGQVDEGGYMCDEKLNLAIYRMLRNILE